MSYKVATFDAGRFAECPNADTIVRLMWAINEMNQLTHLGKLVDGEHQSLPELWSYRDAITGSLMRQRSARVSEILDCIVRPLVADNASEVYPDISELIEGHPQLKGLKSALRELFYKDREEFENHRSIRNRITDHFDHKRDFAILPESLKLTTEQTKADDAGIKRGWLFYGIHEQNREICRFLFADEVLNRGWQQLILQIPPMQGSYANSPEATKAREFTLSFMKLFHDFASKLIDVYMQKYALWLPACSPTDLLYSIDGLPTSLPLNIVSGETHAIGEIADFLGPTKHLADGAATLYENLIALVVSASHFGTHFDINQRTAVFHCLQALRYSMVMSVVTILRAHVTDSTSYSRRSIEIAAFLVEICSDTESAKRWIEMGKSNNARKKYKSAFQAHQLVVKHEQILTASVKDLYDNFCLFVHPSYASMHHQIQVSANAHQFHYFEHQSKPQKANLAIQFFILLNTHVLLMHSLVDFFASKNFGVQAIDWLSAANALAQKTEEAKTQWLSLCKDAGVEVD